MSDELKPCPVCGGECELDEESSDGVWTYIECKTKGCHHGVSGFGQKEIIEFHNDRYPRIGPADDECTPNSEICGVWEYTIAVEENGTFTLQREAMIVMDNINDDCCRLDVSGKWNRDYTKYHHKPAELLSFPTREAAAEKLKEIKPDWNDESK